MPPKTPVAPQVPGETPTPAAEAQTPETPTTENAAPDETVTVSKSELAALLARVAALEANPAPTAKRANPDADLPDQDSIDLAKLKLPVLTKQGWLVPESYGANPNGQKL
jgi:hypothetical protein